MQRKTQATQTTIRISKTTLKKLEEAKRRLGAKTYDEAINKLLDEYKRTLLRKYFGADAGKITPFTEDDRLDVREL